jgi:hypothetical protein
LTGALFFVVYDSLIYVFAMPLGIAYLAEITLVLLSVYALAGLLAQIDWVSVKERLSGRVPARAGGGILAGLGVLFFLFGINLLVRGIGSQPPLTKAGFALESADFLTEPAWILGGVLLFRGKFGYVAAVGLLS